MLAAAGSDIWQLVAFRSRTVDYSYVMRALSAVIFGILGILGVMTAAMRSYKLARIFSIMWWAFTIMSFSLMLFEMFILGEDGLVNKCRDEALDANTCRSALAFAIILLAFHIVLMVYFGMVVGRYAQQLHDRYLAGTIEDPTIIHLQDIDESREVNKTCGLVPTDQGKATGNTDLRLISTCNRQKKSGSSSKVAFKRSFLIKNSYTESEKGAATGLKLSDASGVSGCFQGFIYYAFDVSLQDVLDLIVVAMYGVMALFGLATAIRNTFKVARSFSISWWVFTGITTLKDVIEIIVAATHEETGLMNECVREWPMFACEDGAKALLPTRLAIHVVLMVYFGMTIRRHAQLLDRRDIVIGLPTQFTHVKSEKVEDIEEPLELK
ncbi:hypothetical protein BGX34_001165 [Mortierella sp. NVP85]|nr:hypothetical protein BGX34_001165 [Mortierella sp. NVP85]